MDSAAHISALSFRHHDRYRAPEALAWNHLVVAGKARKAKLVTTVQKWTVNPVFRLLTRLGVAPGYAVLETTGRKTGKARRVPVANGTVGDEFLVVAEQGRRAAWVLNVEANPRVRVLTGRTWRKGTAELLPDDDSAARFGKEIPAWNEWFVRKAGTDMLTVRIRFGEPDRCEER